MVRASVREEIRSGRVEKSPRIPERLSTAWIVVLVTVDALAALAACYAAGIPAGAGPAACVVICGALALCGVYRYSYALHWYDETYHVVAGYAVALVPLWIILHFISGLGGATVIVTLVLAAAVTSALHSALRAARNPSGAAPQATAAYVSPEAQWRVRHGFFPIWKRTFDVVLALTGLIVLSPLMLLAAVCVAIESGFPIFFLQDRVGRGGTTFVMYKFRTMWQDAGTHWVQPGDRRVTNVGALLRCSSIDELPQLFNVLRGDMSLVGPRPEMPQFARDFRRHITNYENRHIVQPGLTGWAQVYCNRNLTPDDMPQIVPYDLFYIEHASPVLDAILVVKTAAEFLGHRGV